MDHTIPAPAVTPHIITRSTHVPKQICVKPCPNLHGALSDHQVQASGTGIPLKAFHHAFYESQLLLVCRKAVFYGLFVRTESAGTAQHLLHHSPTNMILVKQHKPSNLPQLCSLLVESVRFWTGRATAAAWPDSSISFCCFRV